MQLNLKRPIVFFDLETTGLNITEDHIVEICIIKVYPDGHEEPKTMRLNPGKPIPAEASAVHGIYDADVKDKPKFKDVARDLAAVFTGCDIAGFNSNRFDIPMLSEEFANAGVNIDLKKYRFIDVQTIYHKMEPRNLVAAYRFYCGKDLTTAHSANGDTQATYEVLKAQLDRYPDLKNDIDYLSNFSSQNRNVDLAGRIVLNDKNVPVFNFGKHKGKTVEEVLTQERSYYDWMMHGEFPQDTKRVLTDILVKMNAGK